MSLEYVLTLTKGDEEQINAIYSQTAKRLLGRLRKSLPELELVEVPDELDHIVDEVTIARFNRIGSEGMSSESVEGHSASYNDNHFADFEADIQGYIDFNTEADSTIGKVRFL